MGRRMHLNADKLICREGEAGMLTAGKVYDARLDNFADAFIVKTDDGEERFFTIMPDMRGLSFQSWFDIYEEDAK